MSLPPDETRKPLVNQVPPANLASPTDLRPRDPNDVRWYKPGFGETVQLMGWRLIFFLPALALLSLIFLIPLYTFMSSIMILWLKILVPAVVLPTAYALGSAHRVVRNRKEPFCIHCGYDLSGLPDNYTCPECGEPYSFPVIEEYRRDPDWFIKRYKMRGEIPAADVPFEARVSTRKRSRDGT